MSKPIAVLVEDDSDHAEIYSAVLCDADFIVFHFNAIGPARKYLEVSTDPIDLFVLDRRLPVNPGEPASDEFGDELLDAVRTDYPDTKIIVFTGYATVRHVQEALQGGGQLPALDGEPLDRIEVFEKHQSLEFKTQVVRFRDLLQRLDDIELVTPRGTADLTEVDKRVLRRLGYEYRAVSVTAAPLAGGLTGASVWRCKLRRVEGHTANVIAKRVRSVAPPGGLAEMLPTTNATATVRTLTGLISGAYLNVIQLAGESPVPLMDFIGEDPGHAVQLARPVWEVLRRVPANECVKSLSDICDPLIPWESLLVLLAGHAIDCPAGSLSVSTSIGARHGDLHPGNVLVDGDRTVLIDFDSETFGCGPMDPVTMMLSTLVHPDSPIRGSHWPDVDHINSTFGSQEFGRGQPSEAWFTGVHEWIQEWSFGVREFWAMVLAYAARQLRYDDVIDDGEVLDRVLAIARLAASALINS